VSAPVVVLMPVYNDWPVLPKLLDHLDAALARSGWTAEVVVVDDGSSVAPDAKQLVGERRFQALTTVTVVRLGRNVGHQQAIAIGLVHVQATRRCEAVVVMDADGEDSPDDVPRLLAAWGGGGTRLVFAARVGPPSRSATSAWCRPASCRASCCCPSWGTTTPRPR
jgi:polyisoprenyl-phosphate glycosyltransferase